MEATYHHYHCSVFTQIQKVLNWKHKIWLTCECPAVAPPPLPATPDEPPCMEELLPALSSSLFLMQAAFGLRLRSEKKGRRCAVILFKHKFAGISTQNDDVLLQIFWGLLLPLVKLDTICRDRKADQTL